ncbi:hypothetical protein [Metasolibacillus meyeri]|uniref:hypothetical protein n=1 Tax=Metasolibacillus meyeri TaxID=1071052 RepID=UPI000D32282A|nr:hypothetical protein [Metasolibacillus meyeri]
MLQIDEQLYSMTKGKIGEPFMHAIAQMSNKTSRIWGELLPIERILVSDAQALALVKSYCIEDVAAFSSVEQGVKKVLQNLMQHNYDAQLLQYMALHQLIEIQGLLRFLTGLDITLPAQEIQQLAVHKIADKWLIHPIWREDKDFWYLLHGKKLYSVFMQVDIVSIQNPALLILHLQKVLANTMSKNRVATIIHQIIQHITQRSKPSYGLKNLHLSDVIIHFTSGTRHFRKLRKRIAKIKAMWFEGRWALTEKEQTLLAYILLEEAVLRKDSEQILAQGLFLIEEDRLNNHIVELMVEYNEVLRIIPPQPETIVKAYHNNCGEFIFYYVIEALVKKQRFERVIALLKDYEIASCTEIYQYMSGVQDKDLLHKMEASVQRGIAHIIDGSLQNIRQSLTKWQEGYPMKNGPYAEIILMTSKHVCHILKSLWATERFELFERLIEIYRKYLFVPAHFKQLRAFVAATVHSNDL